MEEDAVVHLWRYLNQNGDYIHVTQAKRFLTSKGFNGETINYAIDRLHKLSFLEYASDEKGDGYLLKKSSILDSPLDDLPCLGCEHIHECHIGGDRYSPERCQYFEDWIRKLKVKMKK